MLVLFAFFAHGQANTCAEKLLNMHEYDVTQMWCVTVYGFHIPFFSYKCTK